MLYTKYVLNKDMYTRSGGKWNLKTAIKYPICRVLADIPRILIIVLFYTNFFLIF